MWSLVVALLLPGCSSPPPAPDPIARTPAKAKGKLKAGKGKVKAPVAAPLGVAGDVVGELLLTVADAPIGLPPAPPTTPAPADPEAPTGDEPPPAAPAPGTPAPPAPETPAPAAPAPETPAAPDAPAPPGTVKRTTAELALTFSDASTTKVLLGMVPGVCTEIDPTPVGPAGAQKTPLWTVRCVDGPRSSDLAILQAADLITVVKLAPGGTGAIVPKPVKRIRLAQGATLQKKAS